jgi:hypothetical protein
MGSGWLFSPLHGWSLKGGLPFLQKGITAAVGQINYVVVDVPSYLQKERVFLIFYNSTLKAERIEIAGVSAPSPMTKLAPISARIMKTFP